jgi:dihydroneopterin aldolase
VDLLRIEGLRVDAIIGVHRHERENPQPVIIDLEFVVDIHRAAHSDAIDDALDYSRVATYTAEFVADSSYQLIEALAEELARRLLRDFPVTWVRLCVNKPRALPEADNVRLLIERGELP